MIKFTPLGSFAVTAGILSVFAVTSVDAATVGMRITFDTTVVEFFDNDASGNDVNPDLGTIDFNLGASAAGPLFSALGFTSLETDGAKCTVCPFTLTLDLEASNPGSTIPLEVLVSGIDFTQPPPIALGWIGRFLYSGIMPGGTVLTEAYWDPGNQFFAMTNQVGSFFHDGNTIPPYSGLQESGGPGWASPYSQTLRMVFTFENQTSTLQSQSQMRVTPVPSPASLPLLLGGIALLGFLRARRQS
jgi:hypothetical protein